MRWRWSSRTTWCATTASDPQITALLEKARVVVVPVVNVDGFNQSVTDGMTLDLREADNGGTASVLGTPNNAYKRKNCRVADAADTTPPGACDAAKSPGGYGVGIDPNRNYGGFWGGPGASDVFADPTYRGAGPFSEPETQNIRELVSGTARHHADHQPHVQQPGASPAGPARAGRHPRRGDLRRPRRPDGRAERLHEPALLPALRHHRHDGGLVLLRHRRSAATPSRSARSSTRRSRRWSTSTSARATSPARATARRTCWLWRTRPTAPSTR